MRPIPRNLFPILCCCQLVLLLLAHPHSRGSDREKNPPHFHVTKGVRVVGGPAVWRDIFQSPNFTLHLAIGAFRA